MGDSRFPMMLDTIMPTTRARLPITAYAGAHTLKYVLRDLVVAGMDGGWADAHAEQKDAWMR